MSLDRGRKHKTEKKEKTVAEKRKRNGKHEKIQAISFDSEAKSVTQNEPAECSAVSATSAFSANSACSATPFGCSWAVFAPLAPVSAGVFTLVFARSNQKFHNDMCPILTVSSVFGFCALPKPVAGSSA